MMRIETNTEQETRALARKLAAFAVPPTVYCLQGDLGVGKTVFAKGFAEGLAVQQDVTSPTFGIVNVYSGKYNFYHFDVYRIESPLEMEDTGYEDYFYGDGICLVEWAERVRALIPENAVWIRIAKDFSRGADYRRIEVDDGAAKGGGEQ